MMTQANRVKILSANCERQAMPARIACLIATLLDLIDFLRVVISKYEIYRRMVIALVRLGEISQPAATIKIDSYRLCCD